MRGFKALLLVLLVAAFATPVLAAPLPQAGRGSAAIGTVQYGSIDGRVTAVDLTGKTIRVMAAEGWGTGSMSVAYTDQTVFRQGIEHRKVSDIKVGEHVDIMYAGSRDKWVADNVNILESPVAEAHYLGNGAR